MTDDELELVDLDETYAALTAAELTAPVTSDPPQTAERALALLQFARAAVRANRPDRAATALYAAAQRLEAAGAGPQHAHALAAGRLGLRYREDLTSDAAADALLTEADRQLATLGPDELDTRARILFTAGRTHAWTATPRGLARAAALLSESAGLFRALGLDVERADALGALGYQVQAATGYLRRAVDTLAEAARLVPSGSRRAGIWLSFLAEIEIAMGADHDAVEHLHTAIEIGRARGDDRLVGYAAWERARLGAARGEWAEVERWCRVVEQHPGDWLHHRGGVEFFAYRVEWAWRCGRDDLVAALLAHAEEEAAEYGYDDQLLAARGTLAVTEQRWTDAAQLFDQARRLGFRAEESWRLEAMRGWALAQAGDPRAAASARTAFAEAELVGIPGIGALREPVCWPVLEALLEPVATPAPPRLILLGDVAVEYAGVRRQVGDGNGGLLLAALALAGRPMTLEEIGDVLWPDVAPDLAKQRLRNVLARVRRIAPIVDRGEGTVALARDTIVDITEFEHAVQASMALPPGPERAEAALSALAFVGGPVLPGVDEPRIQSARDRVSRLQRGLLETRIRQAPRIEERIDAAEQLLRIDPFADEPCRDIASALELLGRGIEASVWRDRAARIRDELGLAHAD